MKKMLSIVLVLILVFSCLVVCPVSAENGIELINSLYRLKNVDNEKFTIGYIGGSVTNGTGASDENNTSWRGLTRDWIKSSFPNADIVDINAAIGATGSIYGLYRADSHLIKEKAPDLCFIEFAINDSPGYDAIEGNTIHNNYSNIESIIRKIYSSNPYADIIMVVTGDYTTLKSEPTSSIPRFGNTHTELAEYYDLPVIYVGRELAKTIYKENNNTWPSTINEAIWTKYFIDTVHPTDEGYKIYAQTVINYLETQLLTNASPTADDYKDKTKMSTFPQKTYCETNGYGKLYLDADIVSPNVLAPEKIGGFVWSYEENGGLLPYQLTSSNAGDSITIEFNSSNIGIWTTGRPEGTMISYSVDGGPTITKAVQIGWLSKFFMLAENLDNTKTHTVTITHKDSNPLVINYFMLSDIKENETAYIKALGGENGGSEGDLDNPDDGFGSGDTSDKTMFHLQYNNATGATAYDQIGLATKGKLEAGEYVVSFTQKGYSNITCMFIYGMEERVNLWYNYTTHHTTSQPYEPSAILLTNSASSPHIEYKFTLTEEQANFNYQVFCFYIAAANGKKFDMYLTDFTVYKTDDPEKTNLLYSGDNPTELTGWTCVTGTDANVVNYNNYATVEYIPYNSNIFPKTVLHIGYHNKQSSTQHDTVGLSSVGKLEAGDYVVSFYSNSAGKYINHFLIRGMQNRDNMYNNYTELYDTYSSTPETKISNTGSSNCTEYKFTITEEQAVYNYYIFAFYFSHGSGVKFDLYIDDFKVYKADDPTQKNLLDSSDYKADYTGWASYSYTGASVVNIPQFTAFEYIAYGSGDANDDKTVDIRDLVRIKKDMALSSIPFNPLADMDDNAVINSLDVVSLRKKIMSLH